MCSKEKIIELAKVFRSAIIECNKNNLFITLQNFPNGSCGDASYLLGAKMAKMGSAKMGSEHSFS
jgi:hypothetical protein